MKYLEYRGNNLYIEVNRYANNNNIALALVTDNGEPYAMLTVNINDLPEGLACIDTNNFADGLVLIEQYGLGTITDGLCFSGFCAYPIVELNMDNIKQYTKTK